MKKLLIASCLLASSTFAIAAPSPSTAQGVNPIPIYSQTVTYHSTISPFAVTTKKFPFVNINELSVIYPDSHVQNGASALPALALTSAQRPLMSLRPFRVSFYVSLEKASHKHSYLPWSFSPSYFWRTRNKTKRKCYCIVLYAHNISIHISSPHHHIWPCAFIVAQRSHIFVFV